MNLSGWFRRGVAWQRSCYPGHQMQIVHRAMGLWKKRSRPRYALALAGGGVIGGMYEVGALSALEERLASRQAAFDIYVGCSAGSVVAALLASGIRASEIYQIHDEDLDDPLNMRLALLSHEPSRKVLSVSQNCT